MATSCYTTFSQIKENEPTNPIVNFPTVTYTYRHYDGYTQLDNLVSSVQYLAKNHYPITIESVLSTLNKATGNSTKEITLKENSIDETYKDFVILVKISKGRAKTTVLIQLKRPFRHSVTITANYK